MKLHGAQCQWCGDALRTGERKTAQKTARVTLIAAMTVGKSTR